MIGFGATILAVGLTAPVAQERGGLSVLLGERVPDPVEVEDRSGDPDPDGSKTPPPPPTTCPEDMAQLPKNNRVCIDRGEQPGLREPPKTNVSHAEAAAACEEQGRRLCSAKEWREACRGSAGRRQPYKGPRKAGHCNDALEGVAQNLGRGGARETCVTPEGVFDLVGNAGEWVEDGTVLGGDATTKAASCQSRAKPDLTVKDPAIGFRCCVSLVDPNAPAGAAEPGGASAKPTRKRKSKKGSKRAPKKTPPAPSGSPAGDAAEPAEPSRDSAEVPEPAPGGKDAPKSAEPAQPAPSPGPSAVDEGGGG